MSLSDIERLPIRDAKNLWNMYSQGVVGPYKDYLIAYQHNAQIHDSQQLFISANKSKKHNYKAMSKLDKFYPNAYNWWTLGQSSVEHTDFNERMFKEMIKLRGSEAPEWAKKP